MSVLLNSYSLFLVVDCPLDRQVGVRESLKGNIVKFKTVEEADRDMAEAKGKILGDAQETEEED